MRVLLVFICLLLAVNVASAFEWNERGDAGDTIRDAQRPFGSGELTVIRGTIGRGDADMYEIYVPDPGAFVATTCPEPPALGFDTQLFLFYPYDPVNLPYLSERGIVHNDNDPGRCPITGEQSTITGAYAVNYCGLDIHYCLCLAISAYDKDPVVGPPPGTEMFPDLPRDQEHCPEANLRFTGWVGESTETGAYVIRLGGGVTECFPATPVEAATWGQIRKIYD